MLRQIGNMANIRAPAMVFGATEGLGLALGESHAARRDEASLASSPRRASTGSGMWSPFSQFSAVAVNFCGSPYASCASSPERRSGQADGSEKKIRGDFVRSHSAGKLNAKGGRLQLEQRLADAESQVQMLVKENAGLRMQLGVIPGQACEEKPADVTATFANSPEGKPRTATLIETFLEELSRCRRSPERRKSACDLGTASALSMSLAARLDSDFEEFCRSEDGQVQPGEPETAACGSRKLVECSSVESQLDKVMTHSGSAVIKRDDESSKRIGEALVTPPPRRRVTLSRPGQTARSPGRDAESLASPADSANRSHLEASAGNSSVLRLSSSSTPSSPKDDPAAQGNRQGRSAEVADGAAGPAERKTPLLHVPRSFAPERLCLDAPALQPKSSPLFFSNPQRSTPTEPLTVPEQKELFQQREPQQARQHNPRQTVPSQMQIENNMGAQELHPSMHSTARHKPPIVSRVYLAASGDSARASGQPVKHFVRSRSLGDQPAWMSNSSANQTQAAPCYSPYGICARTLAVQQHGGTGTAGYRFPSPG